MDGNYPICYWKGNAIEFSDMNPELRWVSLVNDKSVGKVKDSFSAGMISFRLSISKKSKNGDI